MAGLKALVCLAFLGSIGMTLLILGCAIYGVWWPFFIPIFYILSPIPTMLACRNTDRPNTSMDVAIFVTTGFVVSAFGLPIILGRSGVISLSACYLSLSANCVIFLTILGFYMVFQQEDSQYNMW